MYGCFWSDFKNRLFGTLLLDNHFQNDFDLVILQKYQSLPNQSFKHTSAHMAFLYLTSPLRFERRFRIFTINGYYTKVNSCTPWTLRYYTDKECEIFVLDKCILKTISWSNTLLNGFKIHIKTVAKIFLLKCWFFFPWKTYIYIQKIQERWTFQGIFVHKMMLICTPYYWSSTISKNSYKKKLLCQNLSLY